MAHDARDQAILNGEVGGDRLATDNLAVVWVKPLALFFNNNALPAGKVGKGMQPDIGASKPLTYYGGAVCCSSRPAHHHILIQQGHHGVHIAPIQGFVPRLNNL